MLKGLGVNCYNEISNDLRIKVMINNKIYASFTLLFVFVLSACLGDSAISSTNSLRQSEIPNTTPLTVTSDSPTNLSSLESVTQTPIQASQIVIPESNQNGIELDSKYPILPDAQNLVSFGAFYSYQSLASIEAAIEYYKSELVSDGWTLGHEILAGNTAIFLFTLGDENLSVSINRDPEKPAMLSIVLAKEE